ncbi:MAG TPA: aldo/keto reductase [Verrucomicrobiae bacterium]|nr:aldo/keto reductase [Verrucomicrobiae bacterium]
MRKVTDRSGAAMPVVGQGTWKMGSDPGRRAEEIGALRLGFDLGMTLVDTAEMYGGGASEELVGEALAGRREGLFVVTKVLPQNASRSGTIAAAEASLRRLRTDRIDLYLLHWTGTHPLAGTLEAFARLRESGKILSCGVSNFDVADLEEAERLPGGSAIAANQVFYNLRHRGIERTLVPWCAARRVTVMAYTPLDDGKLPASRPGGGVIRRVAARHGVSGATVCLAWTLRHGGAVAVAKASRPDHVRENAAAGSLVFSAEDLRELDEAFPAPAKAVPLETV